MKPVICALIVCCMLCTTDFVFGSGTKMKGPVTKRDIPRASREKEASDVDIVLLGAIRFYQKWISPIGGANRCGFRPTCSAYGYQAIEEQGPVIGVLMTADRLMRCNIWKKSGPDYLLLPNGKLYDPPSKNLLSERSSWSHSSEK